MEISQYTDRYKSEVIDLILDIQNNEAKIGLTLDEQPDLNNITESYINRDGNFWVAVDRDSVIGTIGLMKIDDSWCVLKKFFVRREFRSKKVGLALYETLLSFAKAHGFRHIILDTPSVANASHLFYERSGFQKITASDLPITYTYPDRHSILYKLDL